MSDPLPLPATRQLGPFSVSRLAYGCWRFAGSSPDAVREKLDAAEEAGMSVIDTAAIYGMGDHGFGNAEECLGAVLGADAARRDRMVIVTKAGIEPPAPYDSRPDRLIASAEASLRRLQTDRIDLFLIHRPDLLVHPAEVAMALDKLVVSGKVRAIGVSNFSPSQTRALAAHLDTPLVATQPELSLSHPDPIFDGTLDLAMEADLVPMAWSPLAGGRLATGEDIGAGAERTARIVAELDRIAAEKDQMRDVIALAWVLTHPSQPLALIGSQSPDRIRASAAALKAGLTRRDWYALLEASLRQRMP